MNKKLIWAVGVVLMMGAAPAMAQVFKVDGKFHVQGVQVNDAETGASIKGLDLGRVELIKVFGFGMDPKAKTSEIIDEYCMPEDDACAKDVKDALSGNTILALEMEGDPCNSTLVLWDKKNGTEADVPGETVIADVTCGSDSVYAVKKFTGDSEETDLNFVNFSFNSDALEGGARCIGEEKIKVLDSSDVSPKSAKVYRCNGEFDGGEELFFITDGSFNVNLDENHELFVD